ncbi:MAG: PUA domain-containing protein [Methanomassiliicoccales archaeon]
MPESAELRIRRRHRLREKEVEALAANLDNLMGTRTFSTRDKIEVAEVYGLEQSIFLLDNDIVAIEFKGGPFLYIAGILRYGATRRFVTVDMGAVPFVTNGADIMGPGIVDGDHAVREGETVWIRDVKYGKPLAIGSAIVNGDMFGTKKAGKFVLSHFHIGDRLWKLSQHLRGSA